MPRFLAINPLYLTLPSVPLLADSRVLLEAMAVPSLDKLRQYPGIRGMDLIHIQTVNLLMTLRFECEETDFVKYLDEASHELTASLGALELVSPSPQQHLLIAYRLDDGAVDPVAAGVPFNLNPTAWASQLSWPVDGLLRIPRIATRIRLAEPSAPRVRRALTLYFRGLRDENQEMRILSWAMGIDVLLMAATRKQFCERVQTVLGSRSRVLPSGRGGQPSLTVGDLVQDLYTLRSEIAHGSVLSQRFSAPSAVLDTATAAVIFNEPLTSLLEQCMMFVLRRLLLIVLTSDLFNDLHNDSAWRARLETSWDQFSVDVLW